MFSAPGGHHPQQFHPGAATHQAGPPPAKKHKGHPVITKYAPPPGYIPPPPGQPHLHQQPSYYPGYQSYPPQAHPTAAPFAAPQQQHQIYPPQYGAHPYTQAQPVATPQAYQYGYPGWPQPPVTVPQSAPPQWSAGPQEPPALHNPKSRHNSAPNPTSRNVSGEVFDGNGDPLEPLDAAAEDDNEFWGETHGHRHPEDIDPNFSIGVLTWNPATPTYTPLPSTYEEAVKAATLEALAPEAPEKKAFAANEPISVYFKGEHAEEPFLSIRQTGDYWLSIKDDSIFRELPLVSHEHLTLSELLDKYQARHDPTWRSLWFPSPSPSPSPAPSLHNGQDDDDAMDIETPQSSASHEQEDRVSSLDSFQQGLANRNSEFDRGRARHSRSNSQARSYSRAASTSSRTSQKITRPVQLAAIHDEEQEKKLAALGIITGSAKTVYQTPGPALGAPSRPSSRPGSRSGSAAPSSRHASGNSIDGSAPQASRRSESRGRERHGGQDMYQPNHRPNSRSRNRMGHQGHQGYPDPRQMYNHSEIRDFAGQNHSRANSQHSQHAEFYDNDATPRRAENNQHSRPGYGRPRKRSFEHSEDEARGDDNTPRARQQQRQLDEDVTPRPPRHKKARQPRVDEGYSRDLNSAEHERH